MLETEPGALRSRRELERHHRVAEPAGPPAGQPPLRLHFEDLALYPAERLAALQCELPPDLGDEVVGHEPQRQFLRVHKGLPYPLWRLRVGNVVDDGLALNHGVRS